MQLQKVLSDDSGVSALQGRLICGPNKGQVVRFGRLPLKPEDKLPWGWTRTQFPVKVCYAMTINKAQGQTLQRCGVLLTTAVFSHGQLYVALSRVGDPAQIKVYIPPDADESGVDGANKITRNVVWEEVFKFGYSG